MRSRRDLVDAADALGMDALVEVHDEARDWSARSRSMRKLIGVNNRSLATFETDLAVTERLAARVPHDRAARLGVRHLHARRHRAPASAQARARFSSARV